MSETDSGRGLTQLATSHPQPRAEGRERTHSGVQLTFSSPFENRLFTYFYVYLCVRMSELMHIMCRQEAMKAVKRASSPPEVKLQL